MEATQKMKDDIFHGNLQILKQRFPHVIPYLNQDTAGDPFVARILKEDDHRQPIICIQREDSYFCRLYEPANIVQLLKKIATTESPEPFDMVFILGMGLGEAGTEAVRQYRRKPRIVIIEPYPALFRLAVRSCGLQWLLNYERLHLYVGDQADIKQILADCQRILPAGRTLLFIYPYQTQLIGKKYKQTQNDLIDQIRSARDIWHTTRRFGKQMLANAMANLPRLLGGTPLRVLRNRFKGQPIICVAAGPSLQCALPHLKSIKNALMLACHSAVGSLLHAGIQPHIVATADIHPSNIVKLKPHMDRLRDAVLAFGVEADPESISTFAGQRQVGMTAYNRLVLDWLDRPLDLQCRIPSMTSVMHLAVLMSIAMGGDPIILVGVDLAYLNGKSHAPGSVYSHIPEDERLIPVQSSNGGIVYAPPQLVTDRLILEEIIAGHAGRIISVSMDGAMIHGTAVKPLLDVIENEFSTQYDVDQQLESIAWDASPAQSAVQRELQKASTAFKNLEEESRRQCERIACVLKMLTQGAALQAVNQEYCLIRNHYLQFQQRNRTPIAALQDVMLNEIQSIVKKEEMAVSSSNAGSHEKGMRDALEVIDAHYRAIISAVRLLMDCLCFATDSYKTETEPGI